MKSKYEKLSNGIAIFIYDLMFRACLMILPCIALLLKLLGTADIIIIFVGLSWLLLLQSYKNNKSLGSF